jgi:predicted phage gp36 major capsid-like protein
VSNERDPRENPKLDDESDRGDVSKEGFKDYDKEAHPKQVDIDERERPADKRDRASSGRAAPAVTAAHNRFEVHFRMMTIRF